FTNDFTLSIEFSEIFTVFIGKILPYLFRFLLLTRLMLPFMAKKVNIKKGEIKYKEYDNYSSKRLTNYHDKEV
uniref:hypothetical protein n=1 Tax=Blautia sp. TaxID=1955243 RepID=UPI0025C3E9AB